MHKRRPLKKRRNKQRMVPNKSNSEGLEDIEPKDDAPILSDENVVLDDEAILDQDEGAELAGQQLRFRIGNNLKFRRLDKYLSGRFSHFSRTRLQKLITEQGVNVNGRPAKPSCKLNPGDEVDLIIPPREFRELTPENIPLDVLYGDDPMLVVKQQADLIVHPARGYKNGTLVNALVYHYQQLSGGSDEWRPGIVHRLDRNTTGCLAVAKNDTAH